MAAKKGKKGVGPKTGAATKRLLTMASDDPRWDAVEQAQALETAGRVFGADRVALKDPGGRKREAKKDAEAEYEAVLSEARFDVQQGSDAVDEALRWAAENEGDVGNLGKWLEGSLRRYRRDSGVRNRGYDPETGRRLQEDVIGPFGR